MDQLEGRKARGEINNIQADKPSGSRQVLGPARETPREHGTFTVGSLIVQ